MNNLNKKNIFIIGFGGNSKVIIDICLLLKIHIKGIFDDNYIYLKNKNYRGIRVIGKINDLIMKKYIKICKNVVITIGDIKIRKKIYKFMKGKGFKFPNIISPLSYITSKKKKIFLL